MIDAARRSDYALAFETATGFGYGTVARRGASGWRLEVTGKRAHSSGMFNEKTGAGAVYEASRILSEFYKQLQEQYLTYNPGLIVGGSSAEINDGAGVASGKTNVVAEKVIVEGDLRFISEEQKINARRKMELIVSQHLPQTNATITFEDAIPSMPPVEGNYQLLSVLNKVSTDKGMGEVKPWDPVQRGVGNTNVAPYISGFDCLGGMGRARHFQEH